MVTTGLEKLAIEIPYALKGRRAGLLCHAPSITSGFVHAIDMFANSRDLKLVAIFGPQHGIFGQTQDNMIEWEGTMHPEYKLPVYSLYGEHRKPAPEMLGNIDAMLIDIQDAGARLYTYVWTMKLCMEACSEKGIPVWILDRPNPVAGLCFDGPVLKEEYFTFVGGASIPLCHRMTPAEIALWLRKKYYPGCELSISALEGWDRAMMFNDTGLPWVIPSPNMPTIQSATVYPGMVLLEALNISEGRGTTIPFELFGAPFINPYLLTRELARRDIGGCSFRIHDFIPTFHKFCGEVCRGLQIHVTDYRKYRPVETAMHIIDAIIKTSPEGSVIFKDPPYEYEYRLMPFDILSGDDGMRKILTGSGSLEMEKERWNDEIRIFRKEFEEISLYPDSSGF